MKIRKLSLFIIIVVVILLGMVHTPSASIQEDERIKQAIESKAADMLRLRGVKVDLAVSDGYVVLFGTVNLYIQKMLYDQIAWKTEGVIEVDNEILVVPGLPVSDEVIERKIMKVVRTFPRLQKANITLAVKNSAVEIRVTLKRPSDVLFLKRKVAEIDGVTSINIQAKFFA